MGLASFRVLSRHHRRGEGYSAVVGAVVGGDEPVAAAPLGLDIGGSFASVSQLGTQPVHEDLEVMSFARVLGPPDALQQEAVVEHFARAARQLLQQAVLR